MYHIIWYHINIMISYQHQYPVISYQYHTYDMVWYWQWYHRPKLPKYGIIGKLWYHNSARFQMLGWSLQLSCLPVTAEVQQPRSSEQSPCHDVSVLIPKRTTNSIVIWTAKSFFFHAQSKLSEANSYHTTSIRRN